MVLFHFNNSKKSETEANKPYKALSLKVSFIEKILARLDNTSLIGALEDII